MAISALPLFSGTAPNRSQSQTEFNVNMANWISYTTTFQVSYNTFATQANALAVEVNGYATDAAGTLVATQAVYDATVIAKNAAEAAADYKGLWSSLSGALNKPATVFHSGGFWALNNNLANVASSPPSITNVDWTFVSGTRWQQTQTDNFNAQPNGFWHAQIATTKNAQLVAMAAGDFVVISNDSTSSANLTVVNAGYNIRSAAKVATSADNIVLSPGQTINLKCNSATELRVIKNG